MIKESQAYALSLVFIFTCFHQVAPTSASTLNEATEAVIKNPYGITIGGVLVTSENAEAITGDNITGTVSYKADDKTITLNNATITGNIVVANDNNISIKIIGTNVINGGASSALKSEAQGIPGPAITFVKGGELCSLKLNCDDNVTVISTQFGGLNYTNVALITDDVTSYDYQFNGLNYTQSGAAVSTATIMSYLSGEGTEGSPYLIKTL